MIHFFSFFFFSPLYYYLCVCNYFKQQNKKNEFILNTHIGFKENRAIFFKSGTTHSPLTWQEDSSKRYSIICQFLVKDLE